MNTKHSTVGARAGAALRGLLAATALFAHGALFAQAINDVPMAVKNNVAPNFMFMLDNSGSMSNIVPESPYNAATNYTPAGCTSGTTIGNGSVINLYISGGQPYINGTSTTLYGSGYGSANRCFGRTTTYSAKLLADSGGSTKSPSGYLDADYDGNFLNWYFSSSGGPLSGWSDRKVLSSGTVKTRMEIAKTSANGVIGSLNASATNPTIRAGLSTYNGDNGGTLRVAMGDLTPTLVSTLQTSVNGLTASGSTPLAETLADIGRYMATGYSDNITADWVSGVSINTFLNQDGRQSCLSGANCRTTTTDAAPADPATGTTTRPIQYWCQRSYVFMMTDGRPQADQAFTNNAYLRDYDRDCQGALASTCVSNGAAGAWDRKIGRDYESQGSDYLDDVAKALFDVDLRPNLPSPDPFNRPKKNNLVTYTIGFADKYVQDEPLLRLTAEKGGGKFLTAVDGTSLVTAFKDAIADAFSKDAAAAAVAVANAQITLNNIGYASSYKSGAWYGDLVAYSLDTTTALQTGADLWSLRAKLDAQAPGSRKIATYNGTSGVAFAAGLSYTGKPATLTDPVINYLRGDRSNEGTAAGNFRQRQSVLGDIINAEPVVVTYPGNVPIIFQGANDGMLHVVDGRTDMSATTRGQELWAYVPKLLHGNLHDLASQTYSHRYFIDGTPAAAEVTGVTGVSRLLVGGLGKGGRGFYALNISSYAAASDADAAAKVLWEFSHANMGYSFGTPLIVNTAAGWRVLVTSGYDDGTLGTDGKGYVWVLDPATGSVLATLATGAGSTTNPAGLTHLGKLANTAPDAVVRYVWGGDQLGNVWRFDLNTNSVAQIASLTDVGGATQPVTSPPEVGLVSGSSTKFVVMIGTGRYLSDADVPGTGANAWATQRQTVYGLFDDTTVASPTLPNIRGSNGPTCPAGGSAAPSEFVCQALTYNSGTNRYQATTNTVNPASHRGWYTDLPTDANMANGRIVSKPALTTSGTLALTVNIPTNVKCDPGGRSWFLALAGATGGAVPRNVGGNTYFDAGYFLGYALASRPVIVTTADGKRALIRMSDKTVQAPAVPESATSAAQWRRIYWRPVNN